jgi:hypothetical protein
LKRLYLRKLKNKLQDQLYRSAKELPINNWWAIHEGEIDKLFISPRQPKRNEIPVLNDVWDSIVSEFIDALGISKQYSKILKAKKSLILLQLKFSRTNDRRLKLFIEIERRKLSELIGEEKEQITNEEQKAAIEQRIGFQIRGDKTSVIDYYSHIRVIEKQAKAAENGRK